MDPKYYLEQSGIKLPGHKKRVAKKASKAMQKRIALSCLKALGLKREKRHWITGFSAKDWGVAGYFKSQFLILDGSSKGIRVQITVDNDFSHLGDKHQVYDEANAKSLNDVKPKVISILSRLSKEYEGDYRSNTKKNKKAKKIVEDINQLISIIKK